jgi:hypothetical protein
LLPNKEDVSLEPVVGRADELKDYVDVTKPVPRYSERFAHDAFDSIAVHCSLQLTFADNEPKTCLASGPLHCNYPEAADVQTNRCSRFQHAIVLVLLGQPTSTLK